MGAAAVLAGVGVRRLQQAAAEGVLPVQRVVGQVQLVDSTTLRAFTRASRRGRRWSPRVAQAALELLGEGSTAALEGSELSRLRSGLRVMDAGDIAHRLGAAAGWFRYRSLEFSTEAIADRVELTGPSALRDEQLAARLGLVAGPSVAVFGVVPDLAAAEADLALSVDGEGEVFLAQRDRAGGEVSVLVDMFLMGELRESQAAAAELEGRAVKC